MSTEIDQRVVEMRFDNKHFENNVQTTMSSLDKLKQKLRLDDGTKGFKEVESAAKKVDMTHLGKGIEAVQAKFSSMQVVAATALANITNSAINAGKRIASALTIDPVHTGFSEYETQMSAIQTILANTESKGSTLDDVNKALDELNKYADKTIYNFTEMTRNIGTFTAAGVDLDTSVNAIQGISNLAAVSGSTSQQASTAMYQLSQALASGTVKLMDWNSVVNAGMGGQVFQDALKETSRLLGTGADAAIKAEGSFRESLSTGWLTAEVLTETLKKFTESGANERVAEYTGLSKEAVEAALESAKAQYGEADAIKYASKALAEKSGKSADEIAKTLKFAQTATDAATKVRKFSQLWDVMKESAQSGWAQTWELIIGDFEQAESLLTPLANFFTNAIGKMTDARNKLLKGALGDRFSKLSKSLDKLLGPAKSAVKIAETATGAVKDLSKIVDQVIGGKFGNGQKRFEALTKAGYDWCDVQNKVNEKLGNSYRYTVKTTDAQKESTKAQKKAVETQKDLGKTEAQRLETLANMSDAELKNLGYSKDQIKIFRELKGEADKLGMSVEDFVENIDNLNGRTILINSFKNIGQGLVKVFETLKEAWQDIFPPMTSDNLYNIIAGFHKLSTKLVMSDETADKLKRTFKGLFAAVDILLTLIGGPLKFSFKILSQFLSVFNIDILDVTAKIGDAIVKFRRDWLDSVLDFTKIFEKIKDPLKKAAEAVKEFSRQLRESDFVQDLISGFVNGLKSGATKVWNALIAFGKNIIQTVKDVLGIESPSKEFIEIGKNCILGLIEGVKSLFGPVGEIAKSIFDTLSGSFKKLDWSVITNELLMFGALFPTTRIFTLGAAITRYFGSIGGDTVSGLIEGIKNRAGGVFEALKNMCSTIVKTVCDVLGIKSPSRVMMTIGGFLISGLIIGMINSENGLFSELGDICSGLYDFVKNQVGTLANWLKTVELPELSVSNVVSAGTLVGVVMFVSKILKIFDNFGKGVAGFDKMCDNAGTLMGNINDKMFGDLNDKKSKLESFSTTLLKLSISLAIVAASAKLISTMSWKDLGKSAVAIVGLGAIMIILTGLARKHEGSIPKISGMLLSLSVSMLILSGIIAIIGNMEWGTIKYGLIGIGILTIFLYSFIKGISSCGSELPKVSLILTALSFSLLLLTGVIAILGNMEWQTLVQGGIAIAALSGFIFAFSFCMSKFAKDIPKISGMLIALSLSLLLLTGVIAILGNMDIGTLVQGGIMVGLLGGFIFAFSFCMSKYAKDIPKISAMLMALSLSLLLLTGIIAILGNMDIGTLIQGCIAVGVLMAMLGVFSAMLSKYGKDVPKISAMLLSLSLSIGILSIICILLGMISLPSLAKGVVAIGLLSVFMAKMIKATNGIKGCEKNLKALTIAIGVMATAIIALSFVPLDRLAVASGALSLVMGMFALMIKASSKAKKAMGTIAIMMGVIAELTGALWLLAKLPIKNVLAAAIGLSTVLVAFSVAMTILGNIRSISKSVQATLPTMLLIVIGLAAVLAIVGSLPVANSITAAIGLSILMNAMAVALILLSNIKKVSESAILAMGMLTLVVGGIALVIGLLCGVQGIENAVTIASALSILLISMSTALVILGDVGKLGPAAFVGIGALAVLIVALVAVAALIGLAMEKISGLEGLIDSGIAVLIKLAAGIGEMIGAFMGGLIDQLAGSLPGLGQALGDFMVGAQPFVDGMKTVDTSVLAGIGIITAAILALTAADLLNGITSFLTGGDSFARLGTQLSQFMTSATPFFDGAKNIDPGAMEGIKSLAEAVLILTANDLISGLTSWFTGGASLADFGKELQDFAPAIKSFSDTVQGIDNESVKVAAEAGKTLAEMAKSLPNSGGLLGKIMGENDMDTFGAQLEAFGTALVNYGNSVAGLNAGAVNASIDPAKSLIEVADAMPNSGGWLGKIMGENDMDKFGKQLERFGECLLNYGNTVAGLNVGAVEASIPGAKGLVEVANMMPNSGGWAGKIMGENDMDLFGKQLEKFGASLFNYGNSVTGLNVEAVNASIAAASGLIEVANMLPNSGGVISWFAGDNGIDVFGEKIVTFGVGLKLYSLAVTGLNLEAIAMSVKAGEQLAGLAKILPSDGGFWSWFKDDTVDLAEFGNTFVPFGRDMKLYSDAVNGINLQAMLGAVSAARNIVSLIKTVKDLDTSGVQSFVTAVNTLGKASVNKFIDAFNSAKGTLTNIGGMMVNCVASGISAKQSSIVGKAGALVLAITTNISSKKGLFEAAGSGLINSFVKGIKSKNKASLEAVKACINGAVDEKAVSGFKKKFKGVGKDVVDGFVKGIDENTYKAEAEAAAMAKSAYQAAKGAIESSSPSKKFKELGMFADQGLAIGLSQYAYLSEDASYGLGEGVLTSLQESLDINSPARVIKDEVGRYIVQGLAEGIKADMSAEEAAKKKADNIVSAFKTELDKADLNMSIIDIDHQLWESLNKDVDATTNALADIDVLMKKSGEQFNNVELAKGEWAYTIDIFGKDSKEAKEAYKKYVQEQIDLQNIVNELSAAQQVLRDEEEARQEKIITDTKDRMETYELEHQLWEQENDNADETTKSIANLELLNKKKIEQAKIVAQREQEYLAVLNKENATASEINEAYRTFLQSKIDAGNINSEIKNTAQEELGKYQQARKIYNDYIRDHQRDIRDGVWTYQQIVAQAEDQAWLQTGISLSNFDEKKFEDQLNNAKTVGTDLVTSFSTGVATSTPTVVTATNNMSNVCTSTIQAEQPNWYNTGAQLVEGFTNGIKENAYKAINAAIEMAKAALTGVKETLDEHSPSREFYKVGAFAGSGFVNALSDYATRSYKAGAEMADTAKSGLTDAMSHIVDLVNGEMDTTPTIRPVLDLSEVQNGVNRMDGLFMSSRSLALAGANVGGFNNRVDRLSDMSDAIRANNSENSKIVGAITELRSDFGNLVTAIGSMHIRMDSNTVVGELVGKIDSKLGQIANHKGRGN